MEDRVLLNCRECRRRIVVSFQPWRWALSSGCVYEAIECPYCRANNVADIPGTVIEVLTDAAEVHSRTG
jgi:hypothetical protein